MLKLLVTIKKIFFPEKSFQRKILEKYEPTILRIIQSKPKLINFSTSRINFRNKNLIKYQFDDVNYTELKAAPTTEQVDIIICVGQNVDNISKCLKSIYKFSIPGTYKIHLVLHKNDFEIISDIISNEKIFLHEMDIFNFSKANNVVFKQCKNDVILLNDDTEVSENWIEKLKIASKGIALTGARTEKFCSGNPDMWGKGEIRTTKFPINMFCTYIPKRLYSVVGFLDEEFSYYGGEDIDYSCRALLNGFPLVISDAFILHKNNQSFKEYKELLMVESNKIIFDKYQIEYPFNLSTISPFVSIVLATWNRNKLLNQSIDSILRNDYSNFELIIIDDNSTQETYDLVKEYQKKDDRIIYIRQPKNLGLVKSRNLGLRISKGEFIFFTDDDDIVLPNRITDPLSFLMKNPRLDVVYCNFNIIEENKQYSVECPNFDYDKYLNQEFNIGSGILFGRRNAFIEVPFLSRYERAVDYDWIFRLLRKGYVIDLCPAIVMNYNRTGSPFGHLSGNKYSHKLHEEIYEREILLEKIKRK